jgi:hypothetical protein
MKTFLTDIFPQIQRFSEKLDNLTLLTNQHWVSIDDIFSIKTVYIFRTNNELLISTNGKVEKAKWEYLGNKSLLIDKKEDSFIFKHGFFDENILALKIDSKEEYAIFVNENKYDGELNTIEGILDFLKKHYLDSLVKTDFKTTTGRNTYHTVNQENLKNIQIETDKGIIELEPYLNLNGTKAFFNGQPASDGKYKIGFMQYIEIKNGIVVKS